MFFYFCILYSTEVGIFRHSEYHSFQQTCNFSTNKGYYRSCFIDKCQPHSLPQLTPCYTVKLFYLKEMFVCLVTMAAVIHQMMIEEENYE